MSKEVSGQFVPSCSVVICTRDRPAQLNQCLEAVACLAYPNFDVFVVDNAPTQTQTREVAALWGARYVVEPVGGLSRARNRGAREARKEIVAYLDDDAIPEPDWLAALAAEFADPQVMAVTGQTLLMSVETEAERRFAAMGGYDTGGARRRVLDRQMSNWFEIASFGGIGNGMNMAFRRSAFEIWPGFDERLGRGTPLLGAEEHQAFFSLIERGYRVLYAPLAVVRHPCPRTLPELGAQYLRNLAAATGYMTFLFFEEPHCRGALLRYVAGALTGARRPWRCYPAGPRPRIVPWWRKLAAYLIGPILYVRSRIAVTSPGEHARTAG